MVAGELVAVLTTERLPALLPTPVGARRTDRVGLCAGAAATGGVSPLGLKPGGKTSAGATATLKFVLCPGVNVKGSVSPLVAKPLPETVACETDRFAVPAFFSVIVCVFLVPTTTFPKLTLAGTTEI